MSDTPRTDALSNRSPAQLGFMDWVGELLVHARQLEREIESLKRSEHAETKRAAARYEKLRRLNPRQFHDLCARNLAGENFDEMVDKL